MGSDPIIILASVGLSKCYALRDRERERESGGGGGGSGGRGGVRGGKM